MAAQLRRRRNPAQEIVCSRRAKRLLVRYGVSFKMSITEIRSSKRFTFEMVIG